MVMVMSQITDHKCAFLPSALHQGRRWIWTFLCPKGKSKASFRLTRFRESVVVVMSLSHSEPRHFSDDRRIHSLTAQLGHPITAPE
jgi:hypothetical protein